MFFFRMAILWVVIGDASRDRPRYFTLCVLIIYMINLIYISYRGYFLGDDGVSAVICLLEACTTIRDMFIMPGRAQLLIFIGKYIILKLHHPEEKIFLISRIREKEEEPELPVVKMEETDGSSRVELINENQRKERTK